MEVKLLSTHDLGRNVKMQSSALSSGCPPLTLCIFISEIKELLVLKDLIAIIEVSLICTYGVPTFFMNMYKNPQM